MTMDDLYKKYTLAEETIEFIGHAIALHPDTAYRKKPALPTVKRIQLYYESLTRFAGLKSPYIYPLYGLGELPQVLLPRPQTRLAVDASLPAWRQYRAAARY